MTAHGDAHVRPDGRVHLGLTIQSENYRHLCSDWSRSWGLSMSEAVDRMLDERRESYERKT